MSTYIDFTEQEFTENLASLIKQHGEQVQLVSRLTTSAINVALESRDASRLNALASSLSGTSYWTKVRNFCLYATGGLSLVIEKGRPVFIADVDKSCLRYNAKSKAWEILQIQNFPEVLEQWRNNFRQLRYDALNPSAPRKALRIDILKNAYTRLRNNPDNWDASQRIEIAKALDALAPLFGN